jgi:hypothetical protein
LTSVRFESEGEMYFLGVLSEACGYKIFLTAKTPRAPRKGSFVE